jgi:glycosyltransferase involved in cell wall biosynthesis
MKCSVIIPAYNSGSTISTCLKSALNQSIPKRDYEVILVDDGSTDNTIGIAESYSVKIIKQSNQGPAAARNRGAEEAKGNVLIFTDSDCQTDKEFVETILTPFEKDRQIVGVQGSYRTRQEQFVARFAQVEIETRYKKMAKNQNIDFIGTYAAAYERKVFRNCGGFDTSFPRASGEDADFSYKLQKSGHKMIFKREAFVYHQHPSTLSKYLKSKFYRGFWRAKLYRKHPQKTVNDSYTPQSLKFQVLSIPLLILSFALSFFHPAWLLITLCVAIFFVFCSIPFIRLFNEKNYSKAIFIPAMLFLRAAALFFGLILGGLNELIYSETKKEVQA